MRRHEVTDAHWERLAPRLPPQRPSTGRPTTAHRSMLNGILWILRTGAPWRALPERYGSWQTVYSRFHRWQAAGSWERVVRDLHREAVHADQQHAAGARTKGTWMTAHWGTAAADSGARSTCAPRGGKPMAVMRCCHRPPRDH